MPTTRRKPEHPDCHKSKMGLDPHQRAALTGFTHRAFAALAHLREAWLSADPGNARAIEEALRALFQGHSFKECRDMAIQVLRFNHGRGDELIRKLWPQPWQRAGTGYMGTDNVPDPDPTNGKGW